MPTAKDLVDLKTLRENEKVVFDARSGRVNDDWMRDWKDRTENVDRMYRGDFSVKYPNQETVQTSPRTINIVQVGVDDISALAAETEPQLRSEPDGLEIDEVEAAYLREQIASTYYIANDFNTLWVPRFAIDLSMTGAVFNAVTIHPGWDYPRYTRLDPRGSYPRIVNGELIDLLQVTRVNRRDAEAMFRRQ